MPIIIQIPEDDLVGFNNHARESLRTATSAFVTDMVEESNRIESGRNFTDGPTQITSSIVDEAKLLIRLGSPNSKKRNGAKLLRIASAVLSLMVGIMYDKNEMQDGWYLLLFTLVLAATIICVTISANKE